MSRAAVPNTDDEIEKLSLDQLNGEIGRALYWYENGGSSQGRKSFFKRLMWLEGKREELHGVAAEKRRFGKR